MTLEVIRKDDWELYLELKDDLWLQEKLDSYSPEAIEKAGEELIGRVTAGIKGYINREISNAKTN
jgi:hypothetical protein